MNLNKVYKLSIFIESSLIKWLLIEYVCESLLELEFNFSAKNGSRE